MQKIERMDQSTERKISKHKIRNYPFRASFKFEYEPILKYSYMKNVMKVNK